MLMKAIKKVRISTDAFSPRQKTNFLPSWLNKHVLLILTLVSRVLKPNAPSMYSTSSATAWVSTK